MLNAGFPISYVAEMAVLRLEREFNEAIAKTELIALAIEVDLIICYI